MNTISIYLPNKSNRTIHRSLEKTFPVMHYLSQPFCAQAYHSRRSIIHSAYRMQCLSLFSACVFFMHPPPAQLLLGRFYLSKTTFHFIHWFVLTRWCIWHFFMEIKNKFVFASLYIFSIFNTLLLCSLYCHYCQLCLDT